MEQQLQRLMGQLGAGGGQQGPAGDMPTNDNSETIYISSLALLKVSSENWRCTFVDTR